MSVANRALINRTLDFSRFSLSFLRSFSTSSPSTSSSIPNATTSSVKNKRRKKKKNLFEVAHFLPNWGIGYHMAKTHWAEISYQITKINLYKDGKHGKAWGVAHKDGMPIADAPKKISGVHKRCWRYLANLSKSSVSTPSTIKSIESNPSAEVQTS